MADVNSEFFERKRGTTREAFDYETLREEAIALVQAYSGEIWTDFNTHDPGVTLIEAFCYALTDLVYRTEFPVADYLVGQDRQIDYEQLALFRPDQILPSAPVTPNDYRKLLLDVVPHLENVWVESAANSDESPQGVYDVFLQLSSRVKHQNVQAIGSVYVTAVEKAFNANRNLCEQLGQVRILKKLPYALGGRIELQPLADPAVVLAQVYFRCDQYLNPKVQIVPYSEAAGAGQSLAAIFNGPLTSRGYIPDGVLQSRPTRFSIPELIKFLNELPDVKNVVDLFFIDSADDKRELIDLDLVSDADPVSVGLMFPWQGAVEPLQLSKVGKLVPVANFDLEREFSRIAYRDSANREKGTHFDWVQSTLPVGNLRNFADYYSFQHHLPDVYGLNAYGVPPSASAERKAQALQLKAYLLFFDQVMANFLAQVQQIPALLSTRSHTERTHFHQLLDNEAVPAVTSVYRGSAEEHDHALGAVRGGVDDPIARHDRFFDYMLALYGETIDLQPLRELARDVADIDVAIVAAKREYLKKITDLSAQRARGATLSVPAQDAYLASSLQRKIELLLGLVAAEVIHESPEVRRVADSPVLVIEHIDLHESMPGEMSEAHVSPDFFSSQITVVFSPAIPLASNQQFRQLALETIVAHCPAHIYPHIVWADVAEFAQVGSLFGKWLTARKQSTLPEEDLQPAARELALKLSSLHRRSD